MFAQARIKYRTLQGAICKEFFFQKTGIWRYFGNHPIHVDEASNFILTSEENNLHRENGGEEEK